MLKVLHCLTSDRKFIDDVIETVIRTNDIAENHFCYSGDSAITDVATKYYLIEYVHKKDFISFIVGEAYDVIFFHSLSSVPVPLVCIPQSIKIVWSSWGFDIYTGGGKKPLVYLSLYHPLTKKILFPGLKERVQKIHSRARLWVHHKEYEANIHRVDYFSCVLPEEYSLVQANTFFKAKQVQFTYGCPETENPRLVTSKGDNILVGNSGDPTNNHIDVYEKLSKLHIGNRKVYSFLGYGGDKYYLDCVIVAGKRLLGENFVPLTNFLSKAEFNDAIASCGHVVMFHERQQALGNINQAIKSSCKIYLSDTGVVYNSYRPYGIKVFSVQQELNEQNIKEKLSKEDAQRNFDLLQKKWAPDVVTKLRNIYHTIEKDIQLERNEHQ